MQTKQFCDRGFLSTVLVIDPGILVWILITILCNSLILQTKTYSLVEVCAAMSAFQFTVLSLSVLIFRMHNLIRNMSDLNTNFYY